MKKVQGGRQYLSASMMVLQYHPAGNCSDHSAAHKGQSDRVSTDVAWPLISGKAGNVHRCTIDNGGSRDRGALSKVS
ncbi:MAG: hypothetical protein R6V21_09760 [Pelovirga sp.]